MSAKIGRVRFYLFFGILILSFWVISCKAPQIEGPQESYLPSEIAPSLSELPLRIELMSKK
jgi:hypothetical protein